MNVIDDYNREMLAMESDFSLPTVRVIRVLDYLLEFRGKPAMIRVDNGPEFISHKLDEWCRKHKITIVYIQPGHDYRTYGDESYRKLLSQAIHYLAGK